MNTRMLDASKSGFDAMTGGMHGFHLTFDNGCTISVQWGAYNYCTGREVADGMVHAATAEVAAWDHNGDWIRINDSDDVIGYVNADDVAKLIAKIAAMPA